MSTGRGRGVRGHSPGLGSGVKREGAACGCDHRGTKSRRWKKLFKPRAAVEGLGSRGSRHAESKAASALRQESETRNRSRGTNCTENGVSCI
eukprot:1184137-Rhodomonas_salina.2